MTQEINTGPIRHESLSPDLLEKIGVVHGLIGRYLNTTLEEFEIGFMRDMHPQREVALWCRIELAWRSFHLRHLEGKLLADEEEKRILGALLGISTGMENHEDLRVPADVAQNLLECYANPSGK